MDTPGAPLRRLLEWISSQDKGVRQRSGFSMSTLGVCMAKQLFAIAGYPLTNKRQPRMLLVWRLGLLIEKEVIALLRMSGDVVVAGQKEFDAADPPREGHIDGLILRDGKLYLFDVKSINKDGFIRWIQCAGESPWRAMREGWYAFDPRTIVQKDYRPVKEVNPSYYWQAQGYMQAALSREEYRTYLLHDLSEVEEALKDVAVDEKVEIALDGFYLFVYNKNDSTLYEEFVPYDADAIAERLALAQQGYEQIHGKRRSKKLTAAIREFREIEPEEKKKALVLKWQCRRCDFMQTCWADRPEIQGVKGVEPNGESKDSSSGEADG